MGGYFVQAYFIFSLFEDPLKDRKKCIIFAVFMTTPNCIPRPNNSHASDYLYPFVWKSLRFRTTNNGCGMWTSRKVLTAACESIFMWWRHQYHMNRNRTRLSEANHSISNRHIVLTVTYFGSERAKRLLCIVYMLAVSRHIVHPFYCPT